nr:hypothetical protein [Tanacetum cinerariifolium]
MALLARDQRHQYLRFEGLKYIDADIANFRKEGCIGYRFLILEDLSPYWRGILSEGDLLGTALSYNAIRDSMLRMCHWRFALGRKRGLMISKGQFVARLAEHFGLLTKERLQELTIIVQDLPVVDMAVLAVPTLMQAHQQPPATAQIRTIP